MTKKKALFERKKEAEKMAAKEQLKVMTVFRRMCHGDIVPGKDERKLMEYDPQGKADNAEVGFDLPDIDIPETAVESSEMDTEVE